MITKFFKKIFGKKPETEQEEPLSGKIAIAFREKSDQFFKTFSEKFDVVKQEFVTIREKTKDLRTTNHLLGLKHLENGKLPEAIFRFRFMTKMWPDYYDAYFLLAYCLTLKNKKNEAKEILEKLLNLKPDYDQKAHDLLENINLSLQQETESNEDRL